jgi:hypothetical protein
MTAQQGVSKPLESMNSGVGVSKIYEEGIVAGLIGAATIAVWFLILGAARARLADGPHRQFVGRGCHGVVLLAAPPTVGDLAVSASHRVPRPPL